MSKKKYLHFTTDNSVPRLYTNPENMKELKATGTLISELQWRNFKGVPLEQLILVNGSVVKISEKQAEHRPVHSQETVTKLHKRACELFEKVGVQETLLCIARTKIEKYETLEKVLRESMQEAEEQISITTGKLSRLDIRYTISVIANICLLAGIIAFHLASL